jgi:hypothetical protein
MPARNGSKSADSCTGLSDPFEASYLNHQLAQQSIPTGQHHPGQATPLNASTMYDADGAAFDMSLIPRERYYGGFYNCAFRTASRLLRVNRVRGPERTILDWFHEILVGNKVTGAYQRKIVEACGITQPHVTRYLDKLEELDLLMRGDEQGEFLLNPVGWFMGRPRDQYAAIDDWNQRKLVKGSTGKKRRGRKRKAVGSRA